MKSSKEHYYESGKLQKIENYNDGVKNGEEKGFYESGAVSYKVNYVDGLIQGEAIGFFENGKIYYRVNYVDGLQEGEMIFYHENGEIKEKVFYKNGKEIEQKEVAEDNLLDDYSEKLVDFYIDSGTTELFQDFEKKIEETDDGDGDSLSYWWNIVKTMAIKSPLKEDLSYDSQIKQFIYANYDEYKNRDDVKNATDDWLESFSRVRIFSFGKIYSQLKLLESETNKVLENSSFKNDEFAHRMMNRYTNYIARAKARVYGSIKFAISVNISKKKIKQWFPEFIDDEELIEGENPFEALAKKYNVDLPSSTPQYKLSEEEKNKIPEWFTGPVNNEGSTIKDDKTGKEIKLNGIETSIYELTKMNKMLIEDIGNDIKRGKADKSLLEAPLYETMQKQLDKGKAWLKENKIEAYTVIFGPLFSNPQPNPEERSNDPLKKHWTHKAVKNLESKGALKKKNNSKKRQKKNVKNNKIEGINYLIFIPVFYIILLSTVTFINPQNSELDNSLDLLLQYHSKMEFFGPIFIGFILWLCIVAISQNLVTSKPHKLRNRFIITLTELDPFKFLFYFFVILQILNAFLIINQS